MLVRKVKFDVFYGESLYVYEGVTILLDKCDLPLLCYNILNEKGKFRQYVHYNYELIDLFNLLCRTKLAVEHLSGRAPV